VASENARQNRPRMTLADAAAEVLGKAGGAALTAPEIAERAMQSGLIAPRSERPSTYVAAAIRKDSRRRRERGDAPRFAADQGGFRLA
jgi:hypothetical protein